MITFTQHKHYIFHFLRFNIHIFIFPRSIELKVDMADLNTGLPADTPHFPGSQDYSVFCFVALVQLYRTGFQDYFCHIILFRYSYVKTGSEHLYFYKLRNDLKCSSIVFFHIKEGFTVQVHFPITCR